MACGRLGRHARGSEVPRPLPHRCCNGLRVGRHHHHRAPLCRPHGGLRHGLDDSSVALPFIRVQLRAVSQHVFGDECLASPPVRVVAYPQALLPRLARDDPDDRGPIVRIGAVPCARTVPPAWPVARVAMGRACSPPRCGTAHRPQRRCPPSPRWVLWRSAGSGYAAVRGGAVCATASARVRAGLSAPL
jgi:hypothetical protein